ncbi:MAG: cbb3-type cytochrome oxidase assembly protein CcoS [Gammaproteobacteria bacterium]|nr:cbb3-type cytochrome oxidase assembly protein CcoS [Gammaproteobacteria bacterium]
MEMLFILIPLSLGLVAFALWSFVWSVKNDQFDDLERQSWSILFDDTRTPQKGGKSTLAPKPSSGDHPDEH